MVIEVVGQILFELIVGAGSESIKDSVRRKSRVHPVFAAIGHFLMGAGAAGVSLLIFNQRLTARGSFSGLSLLLSPLLTRAAMAIIGARWEHDEDRPPLFSFRAGAVFAFGMALVRFLCFEHYVPR